METYAGRNSVRRDCSLYENGAATYLLESCLSNRVAISYARNRRCDAEGSHDVSILLLTSANLSCRDDHIMYAPSTPADLAHASPNLH